MEDNPSREKLTFKTSADLVREAIRSIQSAREKTHLYHIPSGFDSLDAIIAGFWPGEFVIVGGRPGMGKTGFLLSLAIGILRKHDIPIGYFSLECSGIHLISRIMSILSEIKYSKIITGDLTDNQMMEINKATEDFVNRRFYVEDQQMMDIEDLRNKMKFLAQEKGIKLAFVDYIQLLSSSGRFSNKEQEMYSIARRIKEIAVDLNIPIVVTAQLSRAVDNRAGSKRPLLSDLRDSGAFEIMTDKVMFLYRPEYYKLNTDEYGNPTENLAYVIVAKNRYGPLGDAAFFYNSKTGRFYDSMGFDDFKDLNLKPLDDNFPF